MSETLEYLPVANLRVENVERRWYLGREYLLAPITSIVPGVLNGSRGSLFYPEDHVSANVQGWDGMFLTKGHPQGPEGKHLSAKDEGVWERQGLGVVRDSTYNGKLRHVGWFDAERTRELAPDTYNAIISGRPVEVSTGLFTDNEPAQPGANHGGKPYDYVATNYRPDHIAILENEVGACSVADGCGLNVVNTAGPVQNAKDASGHATSPTQNEWSDEAREASAAARKASGKAKKEGTTEAHVKAFGAHQKASAKATASGDEEMGRYHLAMRDRHVKEIEAIRGRPVSRPTQNSKPSCPT